MFKLRFNTHADLSWLTIRCYTRRASRGRMGPGGLPSLQNCVSGGAPLTGGFDSHAPSPEKRRSRAKNSEDRALGLGPPHRRNDLYPNFYPKTSAQRYLVDSKI